MILVLAAAGAAAADTPDAWVTRFAESHSGAAAAVFFSWKLKPTQQKTVGLRDQGRLFGDPIEEARRAKKLRVDYSIPSAEFAAVGYFIPSDKSVDGEGPLHTAASSGTPCDGVSQLDFGGASGRFRVLALPVWTADPDLGPAGQNGVAAIIEPWIANPIEHPPIGVPDCSITRKTLRLRG